ncbi:F1F0 ATP synthase subunit delta [Saccharomycopsis crataegensis]|uniref:ATP synthase subunit delta, mitochondrial n=1 Tax=Saccharomycopsis crataegensis TaxID=43959 RepID=A0AAV5QQP6_9ASCO|nr:F1F0 ATP synthase subunit delta [Saccharomycopsis crataegensis]
MFRTSLRQTSRAFNLVARRTYAEAAATGGLKLNFSLPHEALYENVSVTQVNIPAVSGVSGILANHVPTIEELGSGVVDVIEGSGVKKSFFVSGGVATVQPGSKLSITAVEAFPVDAFSPEAIKAKLAEAQKNVTSADAEVAAEAAIQVDVLTALQAVAK